MRVLIIALLAAISYAQTVCTLPATAPEGYLYGTSPSIATCTVADCASAGFTDVSCADGYTGAPATTGCIAEALEVVLTGCTAVAVCTLPATAPEGYMYGTSPSIASCTDAGCDSAAFTDVSCADGYSGAPATTGCSAEALEVVLTGCATEPLCIVPATAPEGYSYTMFNGSSTANVTDCTPTECSNPVVFGVECYGKWKLKEGVDSVGADPCTATSLEVSLTGCDSNRIASSVLFVTLVIVGILMIVIASYAIYVNFMVDDKGKGGSKV